jgi:hypothetical protein
MKICRAYIEGLPGSPYSQSAMHEAEMHDRESHDDYDARTWREKCTTTADGQVAIPAMGLKQCVDLAAQKLGEKVPGRRGATYKSFFTSGVICNADVPIANGKPLTPEDAQMVAIWANSDGVRGSGKRVKRRFPSFDVWHGAAEFTIVDDIITTDVFERTLKSGGLVVGIGRYRPGNGGTNGRYRVTKFEWQDVTL